MFFYLSLKNQFETALGTGYRFSPQRSLHCEFFTIIFLSRPPDFFLLNICLNGVTYVSPFIFSFFNGFQVASVGYKRFPNPGRCRHLFSSPVSLLGCRITADI